MTQHNKNQLKLPSSIVLDEHFDIELQRFIYKKSYYEFFKAAFPILHQGESYNDNWHIKLLCDRLQQEIKRITQKKVRQKDIVINVPFRSAKSLITSVMYLPWVWITYPHIKFIYVSYSENLALEHAQFSKNLIYSNWYQNLFGDCFNFNKGEDSKHFYANTSGGFRKSTGTGGQITGSGADIVICLPAGQMIKTELGDIDIKKIVENKFDIKVLSFNHSTNEIEYKKIKRYDKNKGKKLIKITTESGKEIICTEDHEIYTDNRGYVKANELLITDIFLCQEK